MRATLTALSLIAVVSIGALGANVASAEVLWNQSDYDPFGIGFFNSESGGPPFGITQHAVNDVTVGGSGWSVESITTYYSALDQAWGLGIAQGYLHVFDKTGPLPIDGVDDPTLSPVVPMSAILDVDHWVVTASGLNLGLSAGDYWIGITPIAPSGPFGPEIHLSSATFIGDATASYDPFAFPGPPAWFNLNPGLDASVLIEGDMPVPVEETSWGRIKSQFGE